MNINFADYGQERERIATESELEIFEHLVNMTGSTELELVRRSDNYVTAAINEWDLARFKYTPRAKWILFPLKEASSAKHRIEAPSDVLEFSDLAAESLAIIRKYI